MGITASSTTGTSFTPCPSGNHIATCYGMIQIGTEEIEWQGQKKMQHKVRLIWELPNETKVFKEENGEQPYSLARDYTLSMHEKSALRKDLESWRGKAFTEDEAKAFDITNLLGKSCMLNVIHSEKNGSVYANIAAIGSLPKGMELPKQVNSTIYFSYEDSDIDSFEKLPDWIKERMKKTPEYASFINKGHEEEAHEEEEDGLPF